MRSRGEQKVADLLNKAKIKYKTEAILEGCKGYKGKPLRFDFYIPSINCCIEWHGEQHYRFIKHFSKSQKNWLYRREMDLKKAQYCLENNIKLYVIPYTDYDLINSTKDLFQDKYRVKTKWYLYENN